MKLRESYDRIAPKERTIPDPYLYDLCVVGGGVNGCGIAREAAGRGLCVLLCEKGDLGSATSSASTKLFHGGLRYLEHYQFRLVREALKEREVLLKAMPHIAWPLRFVLPHRKGLRPAWLLRLGLFLYDGLGGRTMLPGTKTLNLRRDPVGVPLKEEFAKGFEYSDCWVEDSRLVVLNARDAADRGAEILPRTICLSAAPEEGGWRVTLQGAAGGPQREIRAKALVNAAGPWVAEVARNRAHVAVAGDVRLVRGSHIVVRKIFDHDRAYVFQNADGRVIFALPYERDFTLIGTTDVDHDGDPDEAVCTPEEAEYLCTSASRCFRTPVTVADIVWTYSGVRPLHGDDTGPASRASRDYALSLEQKEGAPLLNVMGGKITTYRRLAEEALNRLRPIFPGLAPPWTASAALPGGGFPVDGFEALVQDLAGRVPALTEETAFRLVRAYGTDAVKIVGDARTPAQLGRNFGHGLYEAEIVWLMEREWAATAEDILWRRSKLGLRFSEQEAAALADWMNTASDQRAIKAV